MLTARTKTIERTGTGRQFPPSFNLASLSATKFSLQIYMELTAPRFYFQPLFQHEVLRVISILNAGSLCSRHVIKLWQPDGNTINVFFIFSEKRHKIVEIFALLTTEIPSYKMFKVGMLFCIL